MAQQLPDLKEQYGDKQVENVVKELNRIFWDGYAEKNLDVATAILKNRGNEVVDTTSEST